MFILFSGEGATDLGGCVDSVTDCRGDAYQHGPMTIIVDQVVDARQRYSLLETNHYGYVPKSTLKVRAAELKAVKKGLRLPGKKRAKETIYFFSNARVLARIALQVQIELDDDVVAVLFRDADGTATADRGLWASKFQAMLNGFKEEGFSRGVPMIPKPKSEAWILCATKYEYHGCDSLEERSGNDNSPNSLKQELTDHFGEKLPRSKLNEMLASRQIDIEKISMPSFTAFRNRLESVI